MIDSSASYRTYAAGGDEPVSDDRLSVSSTFFAVFGLSVLGWAVILAPLLAVLHH
jgi:hypothetical protein